MAASRALLESLLARVRQRALEPRQRSSGVPPVASSRRDAAAAPALHPSPAPVLVAEDEIEEYDEELIEIIDDADVASETAPEVRPLELSASVPSVEMRRRVVLPQDDAPAPPAPLPVAPVGAGARPSALRSAPAAVAAAPLGAETVARQALGAADVVQSQGVRRELRATSFVELLEASLDLGR